MDNATFELLIEAINDCTGKKVANNTLVVQYFQRITLMTGTSESFCYLFRSHRPFMNNWTGGCLDE